MKKRQISDMMMVAVLEEPEGNRRIGNRLDGIDLHPKDGRGSAILKEARFRGIELCRGALNRESGAKFQEDM